MKEIRMEEEGNKMDEMVEKFTENRFDKKFLDDRKIFFWGVVDNDSAKYLTNRLLYLDALKPGEEIKLFINSQGGMVTSGMVIHDTMRMIKSPVATICMGMAASMGAILLAAGEKDRRYIYPHGEVMIHQPSVGYIQGTASDLEIHARQIQRTRELSAKLLADYCGHKPEKIQKDFDRDFWLNAEESLEYGIADKIIEEL